MSYRTLAVVLGAALTIATALTALQLSSASPVAQAAAQSAPAPAASLNGLRIMALGRIEPISEVIRIAGPVSQDAGRIAEMRIKEGEWVEAGAVVAVLDTRTRLLAALAQAEATLALRQATLERNLADFDNQERMLVAALEQQEALRDRAKWDHDRLTQLQQSGMYRDTALIDKRLALEGANQALESARTNLERNRKRDAQGRRIDEAALRADIAAASAALAKARADLEFSLVRAPIAGRILKRTGRAGEQIGQEGLAEIADTTTMMVRAEVFESDLRHIRPGIAASISSRALEYPLAGAVERIGLKVNRQTIIGEDPATALDARVIEVLIRLDEASSRRAAGLTGLQVRAAFAPATGS